jgi:hypothetical protein
MKQFMCIIMVLIALVTYSNCTVLAWTGNDVVEPLGKYPSEVIAVSNSDISDLGKLNDDVAGPIG